MIIEIEFTDFEDLQRIVQENSHLLLVKQEYGEEKNIVTFLDESKQEPPDLVARVTDLESVVNMMLMGEV